MLDNVIEVKLSGRVFRPWSTPASFGGGKKRLPQ